MKQHDARNLILEEWDRWIQQQTVDANGPTGKDSLKFFFELQDTKSPLLDFQSRGHDKWRNSYGFSDYRARQFKFEGSFWNRGRRWAGIESRGDQRWN